MVCGFLPYDTTTSPPPLRYLISAIHGHSWAICTEKAMTLSEPRQDWLARYQDSSLILEPDKENERWTLSGPLA